MPSYSYTAINESGQRVRGSVHADNEHDLETRLKGLGLDMLEAKQLKARKMATRGKKVKTKDLIILCLHLEQLERAGVPMLEALNDAREACDSKRLKHFMNGVYEEVKNGKLLSQAFATFPRVFNDVFVGLVSAGEKTGSLGDAFKHLSEHLKWSADLRRKIKKATRYPLMLLCVISIVIGVMMLYVVPKLVDFITAQGFSLPIHTRALIATSYAFQHYWYIIFGLPITLWITIKILYRISEKFAYKMDSFALKIPLVGKVIRKIELARFTHFFSVMFNSGIDIIDSLKTANKVVHNRVLKEAVELVKNNVTEGNSMTASLRMTNQFPNLVVRMFKVGEDSGNMKEALENINFFYNREVTDAVDSMVGAIQPILTVIMGIVIFWVVAAIFGPLYESFSKMKL